jgi:ATP-dependent protease ClpP protease subunit
MPNLIDLAKAPKKVVNVSEDKLKAEIIIYDAIGDSFFGGVSAKDINAELKGIPSTVKNIDIRLNSPGGDVFDGMTIYERLKQHKAHKTIYVDGLAASIASIIAMAGDEVIMGEGSMFMIHKPLCFTYGNSDAHDHNCMLLDKIEEQMISIYAKKMDMSRAEIAKLLRDETWFNAQETIDVGLASKIIEASASLHMAAALMDKAKWINKRPQMSVTTQSVIKSKLNEFLAKHKVGANSSQKA